MRFELEAKLRLYICESLLDHIVLRAYCYFTKDNAPVVWPQWIDSIGDKNQETVLDIIPAPRHGTSCADLEIWTQKHASFPSSLNRLETVAYKMAIEPWPSYGHSEEADRTATSCSQFEAVIIITTCMIDLEATHMHILFCSYPKSKLRHSLVIDIRRSDLGRYIRSLARLQMDFEREEWT